MKIDFNKIVGIVLLGCALWAIGGSFQAQAASCSQSMASHKVKYQSLGAISQGACRARSPIKFFGFKGSAAVSISPAATTNCRLAVATAQWFKAAVQPAAFRQFGSFVVKVHNISSYACRSRPSGKLSEHAKANALDIKGFTLANGLFISVLKDWHNGQKGAFLKSIHRKACGPFKTVLGPNANAAHRDHFHLDMAVYRSGTYCR